MTGLFIDIIMELVLIFRPSFRFSIRFPCTSELMCSLPKSAGTLIFGAIIIAFTEKLGMEYLISSLKLL